MNVRKLLKSLHSSLPSGLRQADTNGYRFAFARLYERKVQG